MEEVVEQVNLSTLPPKNSQAPKKGGKKVLIIIGLIIAIGAIGAGTFYVGLKIGEQKEGDEVNKDSNEEQQKGEDNENEDEKIDEKQDSDTENEDDAEEDGNNKYSNSYYPDFEVYYDDSWTVSEEILENEREGADDLKVTFEKQGYSLEYYLQSLEGFGGEPMCFKTGEKEYYHLEDMLIRVKEEEGYRYQYGSIKTVDPEAFEADCGAGCINGGVEDYDICLYNAFEGTDTTYTIPLDSSYGAGEEYIAYVSVTLSIGGVENSDVVEEADEIVMNTKY